jgi:hypothetical protein
MRMHIVHLDHIGRSAAAAAEQHLGPRVNPYPEGSAAAVAWLTAYYACVRETSMAAVQ